MVASEDDGGTARSVARLARHLPASGVRPYVVVHRESPLTSTLKDAGTSDEVVAARVATILRGVHQARKARSL